VCGTSIHTLEYSCLYQKEMPWAKTEILGSKVQGNYNIFKTKQSTPP
jgi:hypothetical protein